jgi:hypothetical protein
MNGMKTYAVAAVLIAIAALKLAGTEVPGMENTDPGELIMMALAAAGIRHGIATEGSKQ